MLWREERSRGKERRENRWRKGNYQSRRVPLTMTPPFDQAAHPQED
jgi:hypothetical protein